MKPEEIRRIVRCQIQAGDELILRRKTADVKPKGDPVSVTVKDFYPNYVLTVSSKGFTECFAYIDIYNMLHGVALEERAEAL